MANVILANVILANVTEGTHDRQLRTGHPGAKRGVPRRSLAG